MTATTVERTKDIAILPATYDAGIGPKGRIGFIALANGYTSEHEVEAMLPKGEVVLYVSRVASDNVVNLTNLKAIESDMMRAAGMILPADTLDVMVYSCTSGTTALGEETVFDRIQAVRPGVPVTTPITGALAAFRALGARRVVMLTPYISEVTAGMRDYIEGRGIEVLSASNFNISLNSDMQKVAPEAIYEAAIAIDRPEADAVFVSCTALRTSSVIDRIEQRLGKPVVTSNQALAWHALRLAGYAEPRKGLGRLMTLPLTT